MKRIKAKCIGVSVYKPRLKDSHFFNWPIESDLVALKTDAT